MPTVGQFRLLWAELHYHALAADLTAPWLKSFARRIPCGGCQRHWLALVAAKPRHRAESSFAWTVRLHNEINRRLGKPSMTLSAARRRWAFPNLSLVTRHSPLGEAASL